MRHVDFFRYGGCGTFGGLELSKAWQDLGEDPTTDIKDAEEWEVQLRTLLDCMPFADL
ncbi:MULTISPECIES: hypothetical protein [Achromobacter]|uniref:Uncharacterized protein n=1 Tax=Alcaligenes xylosoxydans xylosoxydans TaxID=85698 RepID=A0A9X3L021_ALCXX|nr:MULTISPECIES: hypothetical protein [Achromobacter]ELQ7838790.1 hypothetical protein [Pseudomonas aeruginosa]MCD0500800.1 hypothetical protein [Achromobacter sp. MY14]MCZ8401366.1 hypothetical protein [Achromobacter xylosoxidans]MCZ8434782.1 hypothetical protein [Achromobacter ruhlandii]MDC6150948.1 hypothetical protein [Achromobacter ruhlandii]